MDGPRDSRSKWSKSERERQIPCDVTYMWWSDVACRRSPVLVASQVVLAVKNPPANAGDIREVGSIPRLGRSPGGGHGNPLAWRIPWTEEPGRVLSMGSQRVRHNWSDLACMHTKAVSPIPLKWSHTILCKTLCETPSVRLGKAFSLIELYFN